MIFSQVQKELNKMIPELELRLIENKKSKKNIQISIEIKNKVQTQPIINKQPSTNTTIKQTTSNQKKSNATLQQSIVSTK
ncbi:MAG: hypothetical protein BWY04_00456 [candidate division CPR1 bacterium ADurb.Bin160]|uniref:Uncharacterized protein n=1 Tax=candidate division CPR1 bacterium ADurb.Bin160 TaxID=1852826 RepID=A0A1V5ZPF8_9BACT|nr:MAG: hypothetical protein BWY04_00456 [candidate division CPR1 bacterium ADurb.Bin160]